MDCVGQRLEGLADCTGSQGPVRTVVLEEMEEGEEGKEKKKKKKKNKPEFSTSLLKFKIIYATLAATFSVSLTQSKASLQSAI